MKNIDSISIEHAIGIINSHIENPSIAMKSVKDKESFYGIVTNPYGSSYGPHKTQIFGMSEDFLIELHGLMEIGDIDEQKLLKALSNIVKEKRDAEVNN